MKGDAKNVGWIFNPSSKRALENTVILSGAEAVTRA